MNYKKIDLEQLIQPVHLLYFINLGFYEIDKVDTNLQYLVYKYRKFKNKNFLDPNM